MRFGLWALGAVALTAAIVVSAGAGGPATPAKPVGKQLTAEQKQQLDKAAKLAAEAGHLFETGKSREAIPPAQEALRIRRKVLGLEDPATATSLADLAMYFVGGGDFAASLPLSQQLLEIRRKILGPEHPDTVSQHGTAGLRLHLLGRLRQGPAAVGTGPGNPPKDLWAAMRRDG